MTPRNWLVLGAVKLAVIGLTIGVVFGLYGCNTVRGVGQDIEKAGESIQRSSNR
ncbi:MAG: entericidin A/B family lipoprotein [Hydrogenophilaceae bacterium]